MPTPAANDRTLDGLYAALTPAERARLLARLWREDESRELDRLRDTIPNDAAGAAYNRAAGILGKLHGPTAPILLAIKYGIDLDLWRLLHGYDLAADCFKARARCHRLWKLLAYPVTEGEYRALVAIERAEPTPLDAYAEILADDGTEDGLNPDVAALLLSLPDDLIRLCVPDDHQPGDPLPEDQCQEDRRRAEAIAARLRAVIDAAIARHELPPPVSLDGEPALPWGVLHDWGEGTTPETYEPYSPAFHVPALEWLWGDGADWDVRPDAEAEAVEARRAGLLAAFLEMAADAGGADGADLAALTLEPPATRAARERAAEAIDALATWGLERARDDVRYVTAQHAVRRAELLAYRDVIEQLRREEFGGEDPLDPFVRALFGDAWETEEHFAAAWAAVTDVLKPYRLEADQDWPPPFEDEAHYERTLPHLEEHIRGDWDD